jgi:hypothetical protein
MGCNTTKLMHCVLLLASLFLTSCGGGGGVPTVAADPFYGDQWHLKNTGQAGANGVPGVSGEDMNMEPAWANYKVSGVRFSGRASHLDYAADCCLLA